MIACDILPMAMFWFRIQWILSKYDGKQRNPIDFNKSGISEPHLVDFNQARGISKETNDIDDDAGACHA